MKFIREAQRDWAEHARSLGFGDFVSVEDGFSTELATGMRWAAAGSCGVYTWITEDGFTYVGQAVRVRERLRTHWRNHPTLTYAAFQPVDAEHLDEAERRLANSVAAQFPSLNIKLVPSTASKVPLDLIVGPAAIDLFLWRVGSAGPNTWREWPLLERKQAERFNRSKRNGGVDRLAPALGVYLSRCIPQSSETEVLFWSTTLLSANELRVNVGQQEVCTLFNDGAQAYARVLAPQPLRSSLFQAYPTEGPLYATASYVHWVELPRLARFFTSARLLQCRKLVVYLMRHTTTLNSGSHCPQMVRAALPDRS